MTKRIRQWDFYSPRTDFLLLLAKWGMHYIQESYHIVGCAQVWNTRSAYYCSLQGWPKFVLGTEWFNIQWFPFAFFQIPGKSLNLKESSSLDLKRLKEDVDAVFKYLRSLLCFAPLPGPMDQNYRPILAQIRNNLWVASGDNELPSIGSIQADGWPSARIAREGIPALDEEAEQGTFHL